MDCGWFSWKPEAKEMFDFYKFQSWNILRLFLNCKNFTVPTQSHTNKKTKKETNNLETLDSGVDNHREEWNRKWMCVSWILCEVSRDWGQNEKEGNYSAEGINF